MTAEDRAVVLVVDDEENVAEVFALWLEEDYEVRVALSGEEAMATLDDGVDAVLLDRRMPGLSGDDVLEKMRGQGLRIPVAMVTAVDPDFDILEMAFDDYLTKPVSKEELKTTIERLLTLSDYDVRAQQHFALAQKLATVESEKSEAELDDSEEYQTMREQMRDLQDEMDALVAGMDERASTLLFKGLDRNPGE